MVRHFLIGIFLGCYVLPLRAEGPSGYDITKVNHEFIDKTGVTHQEIASFVNKAKYQEGLEKPGNASGMRFIVHWKAPSTATQEFTVRVEARGLDASTQNEVIEMVSQNYPKPPSFSGWTFLDIKDQSFKRLGKLMAWKVTLLQNGRPVATRKSSMWDDSIQVSQEQTTTQ